MNPEQLRKKYVYEGRFESISFIHGSPKDQHLHIDSVCMVTRLDEYGC